MRFIQVIWQNAESSSVAASQIETFADFLVTFDGKLSISKVWTVAKKNIQKNPKTRGLQKMIDWNFKIS